MKIYNANNSRSVKQKSLDPKIIVRKNGCFSINQAAISLLGIEHNDEVVIGEDDGQFYIKKCRNNGFKVRKSKGKYGEYLFSCALVTRRMIAVMDLAIGPDKKNSVRLDVSKEQMMIDGVKWHEIS